MNQHDSELETVAIASSLPQWRVLTSMLEAYGLHPMVRNAEHISAQPPLMLVLGGIAICVPTAETDDALALIDQIEPGDDVPLRFPFLPVRILVAFFLLLLAGVPLPAPLAAEFRSISRHRVPS